MKILHITECLEGGVGIYLNNIYKEKESIIDYHFFVPKSEKEYLSNKIILNNHCTFLIKKIEIYTSYFHF